MTKGQEILEIATKYNYTEDMLFNAYNISSKEYFDAIIIAPTWTPYRINGFSNDEIMKCKSSTNLKKQFEGKNDRIPMMKRLSESYIVNWNGYRIAWVKTGTCAGNVIDSTLLFANNKTEKFIFLGAAGGLVSNVKLGEIITPSCCVDCVGATRYFSDRMKDDICDMTIKPNSTNYIERIVTTANQQGISLTSRKVFCTDTILGEYLHMNKILNLGAEVIEMETSAFYRAISLMEKTGIAFLVISDNYSIGGSLSAPDKMFFEHYNDVIKYNIPKLIDFACKANK